MTPTHRYIPLDARGRPVGQFHHRARLTDDQIEAIRTMREEEAPAPTYRQIAQRMKAQGVVVSRSTVAMVCRYERRAVTVERWKKTPC